MKRYLVNERDWKVASQFLIKPDGYREEYVCDIRSAWCQPYEVTLISPEVESLFEQYCNEQGITLR